jgi:hypothetical protein
VAVATSMHESSTPVAAQPQPIRRRGELGRVVAAGAAGCSAAALCIARSGCVAEAGCTASAFASRLSTCSAGRDANDSKADRIA